MKKSVKTGIGFGFTSAIITTLGAMIGLYSGTLSDLAVIGGILTIAIADAFSDSLGIHISKELEGESTILEIWEATATTFFAKVSIGLTFLVPVLIFDLKRAVWVSIFYGMVLLGIFSYFIARSKKAKPARVIIEHLFIAIVVIILSQVVGHWIRKFFV